MAQAVTPKTENPRRLRQRIRIIYPPKVVPFTSRLEQRARKLTRKEPRGAFDDPLSMLERKIALTVEQIDTVRDLHHQLDQSLVRFQDYLHTEIRKRAPRSPAYQHVSAPECDRLRNRIQRLEQERRHWKHREQDRIQSLHLRLLEELDQHTVLRE